VTNKVTLRIAAHLAHLVKPETSKQEKLRALAGEVAASPVELVTLCVFLRQDQDPEVQTAAVLALRRLNAEELQAVLASETMHPRILALLARLLKDNPLVLASLAVRQDLDPATVAYVQEQLRMIGGGDEPAPAVSASTPPEPEMAENAEDEAAEESEEFHSKYQLAQIMGTAEKIKMAFTGDKEWRTILLKDSNKLVSGSVIKNPRITEAEVLTVVKSSVQNDEIIRVICANKEWLKNYQIRKGLVENHKTPLPNALRFLTTLTEKDLGTLAKSKNVSTVIATQARRILLSKQKK
jgi:hypothetical protein